MVKYAHDLILRDIIPSEGLFDITERMLDKYIATYSKFANKGNNKYNGNFARKLAGLNLLKLKLYNRNGTPVTCGEGILSPSVKPYDL